MSLPYRGTERRPMVAVAERGRSRAAMLAFAVIAIILGFTFATTARVTLSCTRVKVKSSGVPVVSCYVEQSGAWSRRSETLLLRDPQHVKVETLSGLQRVTI